MTCYVGKSTTPNEVCSQKRTALADQYSGAYPHSAITDRALPGAAIGGASSFCQLIPNVALLLVCGGRHQAYRANCRLLCGRSNSTQSRIAAISPAFARSIAFRTKATASPSSSASANCVARHEIEFQTWRPRWQRPRPEHGVGQQRTPARLEKRDR
jgi:hypothetical protein